MADTYGVLASDVAAELPGLFLAGFTQATKPTLAQVTAWISVADARAYLAAQDIAGAAPSVADKAAPIVKDYIIQWVKGKVLQAVYAGKDPAALAAVLQPVFGSAKEAMQALMDLGTQLEGAGTPSPKIGVSIGTATSPPVRDLLIDDADLDGDRGPSGTSEVLDSSTRWHRRGRF